MRPDRGPVDWSPIERRRKQAEARIAAIETYAGGDTCRRRVLVGYFGEKLRRCAGCDRCGNRTVGGVDEPAVKARLLRLRSAVAGRRGPWGGTLLEPEIMLRLARQPPRDVSALADVPGVGPALAASVGRTVMLALEPVPQSAVLDPMSDPLLQALWDWRVRRARDMGVAPFVLLGDTALELLAKARPAGRSALARVPGVGPRMLAKFAEELLSLIRESAENPSGESAHESGESAITDPSTAIT